MWLISVNASTAVAVCLVDMATVSADIRAAAGVVAVVRGFGLTSCAAAKLVLTEAKGRKPVSVVSSRAVAV